ncbi:MAG TPA: hypothetical protein VIT20_00290 [Propionibacteriaceae bacterium]
MTAILISMIIILVIAASTVGIVLIGMEGRGKSHAPKIADKMARAAQHLNGDGQPPRSLQRLLH